ncbi:MAG: DUF6512 family protein [Acutalibacteraceae bacterium]|jgi:hypothetical protein
MNFKKNIIAFVVIGLLGTLGHFLYEWTNENFLVGLFFPVSESIWEHLKLLFYPTILYSAVEYLFTKEKPKNYASAVVLPLIYGMFFIVAAYYIYTGIIGRDIDFFNILIFFLSIIIFIIKRNKLIKKGKFSGGIFNSIFLIIVLILMILFGYWSHNPPSLGIFMQPTPIVLT